jgi:hypothetical protein
VLVPLSRQKTGLLIANGANVVHREPSNTTKCMMKLYREPAAD